MPNVAPVPKPAKWFIDVLLEEPTRVRTRYSMGPFGSWSEARGIANKWEAEFGPNTTDLTARDLDDRRWGNSGRPRRQSV